MAQLGLFDTQEEAAKAYDIAVLKGGRKERTNFPPSYYKDGGYSGTVTTGRGSRNTHHMRVTSQYKGVSWNSACSKWVAVLWDRELKRARHIGSFESEEDAARAYDREAIKMLGSEAGLNFRESMTEFLASTGADVSHLSADAANLGPANKGSSQYRGVSWHERSQRWEVRVWGGGKQHFIGSFTSETEAARAYDKAVLRLRGQDARSRSRMNFPLSDYNIDEINAEPLSAIGRGTLPAFLQQPISALPVGFDKPTRRSVRQPRRRKVDDEMTEDSEMEETEPSDMMEEDVEVAPRERSSRAAAAAAAAASQQQQRTPPPPPNPPRPLGAAALAGLPGVSAAFPTGIIPGMPCIPSAAEVAAAAAAAMGSAPSFFGVDLSGATAASGGLPASLPLSTTGSHQPGMSGVAQGGGDAAGGDMMSALLKQLASQPATALMGAVGEQQQQQQQQQREQGVDVRRDEASGKWQTVQRNSGQVTGTFDKQEEAAAAAAASGEALISNMLAMLAAGQQQQQGGAMGALPTSAAPSGAATGPAALTAPGAPAPGANAEGGGAIGTTPAQQPPQEQPQTQHLDFAAMLAQQLAQGHSTAPQQQQQGGAAAAGATAFEAALKAADATFQLLPPEELRSLLALSANLPAGAGGAAPGANPSGSLPAATTAPSQAAAPGSEAQPQPTQALHAEAGVTGMQQQQQQQQQQQPARDQQPALDGTVVGSNGVQQHPSESGVQSKVAANNGGAEGDHVT
uniref:AP2/ERF domain-containing protein n=1 Tax=Dunaliella tertiolecta TaxID=3047 RepID=A0A7S3QSY1_DUNTE